MADFTDPDATLSQVSDWYAKYNPNSIDPSIGVHADDTPVATSFVDPDTKPASKFVDPDSKKTAFVDPDTTNPIVQTAKNFIGGPDAALSMIAGLPAYIASGWQGLGNLVTSGGDINKAGDTVRNAQESNFGLGAPKPFTKEGQQVQEMLGAGSEYLNKEAGKGGYAVGGELGRANAEIASQMLQNFLPIPGGKGVHMLGEGIERRFASPISKTIDAKLDTLTKPPEPTPEAPTPEAAPVQGDLFGNGGWNEQQMAESKQLDTNPGQPDLFGPQNVPKADLGAPVEPIGPGPYAGSQRVGNNEPMDMPKSPYPVSAEDHPPVLQDAPYQPQGSLDLTEDTANRLAAPLEQDINNPAPPPEITGWENEGGNTAIASTGNSPPAGASAAYWDARQRGVSVPKGQRGAFDVKAFESIGSKKQDGLRPEERVVLDALGKPNYVTKLDDPQTIIDAAKAEGKDGPSLWQNMQSGLLNAAEKTHSALQFGVARAMSYADKMGERYITNEVSPVERVLKGLNKEDMIAAQKVLQRSVNEGRQFTREELKGAGISDKAIEAHQRMSKALEDVRTVTNASLRALGKKEISPQESYMASMWDGNWHVPIKDKEGKLAWYLKLESKGEANKAIAFLKGHPELGKTLDFSNTKPKYMPSNIGSRVPRDVMGAYHDMLQFFDGETAQHMQAAMQAYTESQGYKFQQHQQHFKNKIGVRGYQGDRPWLSEHANALALARAQINYLKEAYRWAPMQESIAHVKQIMSDPELAKTQPNNMELAKAYFSKSIGLSQNLFKAPEQAAQRFLSSLPIPHTFQNIGKFVSSLKEMTYLTQLGLSGGYMIATPLQAFLLAPSWHLKLSNEGFGHSALMTSIKALADFSGGLVGHPVSKLGEAAFRYMKDNGVISQNILHDRSGLGEYAPVHALKQGIGWTISMPEKVARAATFMSFAHHLEASGKFTDQSVMFRRADELTNHVLTDFRKISRPLLVDKAGQLGELGYTYKSPLFNQYNNLSVFARDAKKGNMAPLVVALGMSALLGGLTTMPFVGAADTSWNLLKEAVARAKPDWYPAMNNFDNGMGLKGNIISKMNEVSANDKVQAALGTKGAQFLGDTGGYGAVSAATGSQMASRFSSDIGDVTNPLKEMAPVGQEAREWLGAGLGMINPNSTTITQGAYSALAPPAVKGNMENEIPNFKSVKTPNGQGYVNPNKIEERNTQYFRTPHEEMLRRFGMTSLQEATTKNSRYLNQEENMRLEAAQKASVQKMFDAIERHDQPAVQRYARSFVYNNGDPDTIDKQLDEKINQFIFDPQQRAAMKMETISTLKNYQRLRSLQGR